jgi:hypothetical protein
MNNKKDSNGELWGTNEAIEAFIRKFEACRLPKVQWTHHAHLLAGLWYLSHHHPDDALAIMRCRIRAHNEFVGIANTDSSGYHETLTCFFLQGIASHRAAHCGESLLDVLASLLQSPLASKDWPLASYSRERLFSVAARRQLLKPDLIHS